MKTVFYVIPAKAGIHCQFLLDSRIRGNDEKKGLTG